MRPEAQKALDGVLRAIGSDAVRERTPLQVDDCSLDRVISPGDGAGLAETLSILDACGARALVSGGGSRLGLGNSPQSPDLLLSTHRMNGVAEFDPTDGVAQVLSGTSLDSLRSVIVPEGWDVALDPWGREASVGGALAASAVGPRCAGFGPARNSVLGLDVALPSGDRTRCGGRVVKNVTGYDLGKLYTGSLGTLGVIEAAWLRLRPIPEAASVYCIDFSQTEGLFEKALEIARRPTVRVAALLSPVSANGLGEGLPPGFDAPESAPGAWRMVVELAGDEPAVHRDGRWLREGRDSVSAGWHEGGGDPVVEALRALQGGALTSGGVRARLSVRPTGVETLVAQLAEVERGRILVYPSLGLVYLEVSLEPDEESEQMSRQVVDATLARVDAAAAACGAGSVFEVLPAWAKANRDVFGVAPGPLALMRGLKRRFDPNGVLNAGRFAGGL